MGDSSDNIPGIPGVGEKTATKMIVQFGSIENAHEHLEEVKPNKAKESLREHYDLAQLSKELATINTDSPLEFSYEKAKVENPYTPEAYELCKRLEFKNMLNRFDPATTADSWNWNFLPVMIFPVWRHCLKKQRRKIRWVFLFLQIRIRCIPWDWSWMKKKSIRSR